MDNNTAFSKYKLLAIDIYEWCKKHDYYELGHAWNLAAYEI